MTSVERQRRRVADAGEGLEPGHRAESWQTRRDGPSHLPSPSTSTASLWLADEPIPGAADAVARLRAAGVRVVFVTNNAYPTVARARGQARSRYGVDADGAVLTSPMAAASLLHAGERVLVAGGPGIVEAVGAAGAVPVSYEAADAGAAGRRGRRRLPP